MSSSAGSCWRLFSAMGFAADQEHATVIREESLYVSRRRRMRRSRQVSRGSALTVLERSNANNQPWMKVSMAADQQAQVTREITGWLPAQTFITAATPER